MLVEATLTAVGFPAGLYRAFVVALDLVSVATHALSLFGAFGGCGHFLVLSRGRGYLVLAEPMDEVVLLLDEFLDLGCECDVSEVESAVLVVVAVFLVRVAGWGRGYIWNSLSSSKASSISVKYYHRAGQRTIITPGHCHQFVVL